MKDCNADSAIKSLVSKIMNIAHVKAFFKTPPQNAHRLPTSPCRRQEMKYNNTVVAQPAAIGMLGTWNSELGTSSKNSELKIYIFNTHNLFQKPMFNVHLCQIIKHNGFNNSNYIRSGSRRNSTW